MSKHFIYTDMQVVTSVAHVKATVIGKVYHLANSSLWYIKWAEANSGIMATKTIKHDNENGYMFWRKNLNEKS